MSIINNCYTIYLHVFPDGKKYVGCTGLPVRERWDGGLGYKGRILDAIIQVGWENIRHYILFENLSKDSAILIEAALIRTWHTYRPSVGYNTAKPSPNGIDKFVLPKISRKMVVDDYDSPTNARFANRKNACAATTKRRRSPIRLVETSMEFESLKHAASYIGVSTNSIKYAADNPNRTCGYVWIEDPDEGWRMEVRAHWEYINKYETKDD